MEEMIGAICDPIIVYPGGWADAVPDDLKQAITMDRMFMLMKANKANEDPTATDSECCAYFTTASFEAPMTHEWTQIYCYCATQYLQFYQREIPDDVRVNELTRDEERQLNEFKRWLYQAKVKHRARRRRESKAEEKEQKAAAIEEECPQLVLF